MKLSKKYLKAKQDFLQMENPAKKMKRLWEEQQIAFENYIKANKAASEFQEIEHEESIKYDLEIEKVSDTLANWADRNDWLDVRFPVDVGVGDFPF